MTAGRLTPTVLLCACLLASEPSLSPHFRTVYILQMADQLDQHLASRLSNGRVLMVVLDPASADAVMTDSIDTAFWTWMQRTYPPSSSGSIAEHTRIVIPDVPPASYQHGTIFLVDPRTRVVLWSTYQLPKNNTPSEMDRVASRVANQLKSALGRGR